MNLVAGLMWGALGGLTRDMSPRLSRGAAFGLLTVGAVTCQWLWVFVPGHTLAWLPTWQSQIVLMGILAIILFIPVALWLKDLSPRLRMMVIESESAAAAFESGEATPETPAPEVPGGAMHAFSQLLGRWQSWVLVVGVIGFLTVAITIQNFGPLMFEQALGYDHATADQAAAGFWLLNLVMLVPAGLLSDWLRVRKPVTLVCTAVMLALLVWWLQHLYPPLSPNRVWLITLLMGGIVASAFIPWCALYSEYVEDLSPALQATGWSFFQLIFRIWNAASAPILTALTAYVARREAAALHLSISDAHAWSIGWATWMDVMVAGVVLFVASLFIVRGGWKPVVASSAAAPHGAPAHAAGGR
jgi:OPA family glycerol-3-phosphate transporter-like MFS transporter